MVAQGLLSWEEISLKGLPWRAVGSNSFEYLVSVPTDSAGALGVPRTCHRRQAPPYATPRASPLWPPVLSLIFLSLLYNLTLSLLLPSLCLPVPPFLVALTVQLAPHISCLGSLCLLYHSSLTMTNNRKRQKRKYLLVPKWLELMNSCFGAYRSNLCNCGSQRVTVTHAGISF